MIDKKNTDLVMAKAPTLTCQTAILPRVMVGDKDGIVRTVCDGNASGVISYFNGDSWKCSNRMKAVVSGPQIRMQLTGAAAQAQDEPCRGQK